MNQLIVFLMTVLVRALRAVCRSKRELVFENLALRQQVTALKQKRPRPHLYNTDRAFWVALRGAWARWAELLVIVKPETVVDWHRRRFRRHWTKISRRRKPSGRRPIDAEIRDLIRKMVRENDWGAPRVHSELVKLGFEVSESTVSRYMRRFRRRSPDTDVLKRWVSFLRNPATSTDILHKSVRTFDTPGNIGVHGRAASFRQPGRLRPTKSVTKMA